MGSRRFAGAALAALLAVTRPASGSEPLVFVADPKMGVEASARSFDSVERLLRHYEDALPTWTSASPTFAQRAAGLVGRALKLVFVDEPLSELTATALHEAGGHGARARELDIPAAFSLSLPGIYRPIFETSDVGGDTSGYASLERRGALEGDRATLVTIGGIEAGKVREDWIRARVLRAGGEMHHGDALAYMLARSNYAGSLLSVPETRGTGNDVAAYVAELREASNGSGAEDRARIANRLSAAYLWNLADPFLFYAAYATVVPTLLQGKRTSRMPLPRIGDTTFLPTPRFALTPFGAENALGVTFARSAATLDVYGRVGTTGLFHSHGLGARALGIAVHPRATLGAELDVWRQPELLLDQRFVFDRPMRLGANAGLYADVRVAGPVGLTGKLAVKSAGYLLGQPVGAGPYGYVGLRLALR